MVAGGGPVVETRSQLANPTRCGLAPWPLAWDHLPVSTIAPSSEDARMDKKAKTPKKPKQPKKDKAK
jgi:hypothetical protein